MAELDTPGKRLEYWIETIQKETMRSFSQFIGVGDPSTIYSIVKDKTDISPRTLSKITDKFPDFPVEWIRTGEGPIPGLKGKTDDIEVLRLREELAKKDEEVTRLNKLVTELIDVKVFLNNQYKEIIERANKTIKEQQELINSLKSLTNSH